MFSRVARRVLSQQKRSFSNINEVRAKFYSNPATGVENPTYLKEGQVDKILFATAMGGVVVGTLTVVYGLLSMMFGVNKVK